MTGISVIVPTRGRHTLERCLSSIVDAGLDDGDEVLVVMDTHEMHGRDAEHVAARISAFGPQFQAIPNDAGRHTWGHDQINVALAMATEGHYLTFNDDDDVYTPGAFNAIRAAARRDDEAWRTCCHIFRFRTHWGDVLPVGEELAHGRVGGHCIVVPNLPGMVGRFTARYEGDWDFIADTVERWGENVVFEDTIIAIARPPA